VASENYDRRSFPRKVVKKNVLRYPKNCRVKEDKGKFPAARPGCVGAKVKRRGQLLLAESLPGIVFPGVDGNKKK